MFIYLNKILSRRLILKDLSWYMFGQVIVQGSSFVSAIIVSRYLGPTNLGLLSFSQNFVSVVLSVVAGADFYLSWQIATSSNFREQMGLAFAYKIRLHTILAVFGSGLAFFFLPWDVAFLCIILFVPSILQSFTVFAFYALSRSYAKQMGIIQASLSIFFLVAKIIGVYLEMPITYYAIIASFDAVMLGLVMYTYCSYYDDEIKDFFATVPAVSLVELVRFCFKISVSIIAIFFWGLLLRVDQFLLALFTDAHTLGLYAAAVKIAEMPNIIAGVVTASLTSRIALLPATEKTQLKKKITTLIGLQGLAGFFIMVVLVFFAPLIMKTIYGHRFDGSEIMLKLYALTIPFMFINYVFHSMYGSFSLLKFQAINYGLAVLLNCVLGYFGYIIFGVYGIIYATILAYAGCSVLGYFYLRRTIY